MIERRRLIAGAGAGVLLAAAAGSRLRCHAAPSLIAEARAVIQRPHGRRLWRATRRVSSKGTTAGSTSRYCVLRACEREETGEGLFV